MNGERGAALVETALLLPMLLLLLMGVVDLGRAFATHIAVQDASQEGAMVAAFNPADGPLVVAQTVAAGASVPIAGSSVTVRCDFSPDLVTVEVSHELTLITPMISNMLGGSITLIGSETATVFSSSDVCAAYP